MKKYFVKYLPIEDDIKTGDTIYQNDGNIMICTKRLENTLECSGYAGEYPIDLYQKVELFLCTRDIGVGDKVYPFIDGHCDNIEESPFHPKTNWDARDFMSGWPEEPHTIEDLNHSDYKPYRIRTDFGFGSPGRYIKVIGKISPDAIWVRERDEFTQDEIEVWITYCGQHMQHIEGYTNHDKDSMYVKVKCDKCNSFH